MTVIIENNIPLPAAGHNLANAAENPARMAQEQHA
jgi:hypothetical protein